MTGRHRGSASAKPSLKGKQESDPTKGLTYEELGRNNGRKKTVVEELEDCLGIAAERIQ